MALGSLRSRHLAARVIGPIAIKADHTPFDAPGHADHAGVLADPVVHRVLFAIVDQGYCLAEPARDGASGPGLGDDFVYPLEIKDSQVRVPELAFLLRKARGDLVERGFARRQHAVEARATHI